MENICWKFQQHRSPGLALRSHVLQKKKTNPINAKRSNTWSSTHSKFHLIKKTSWFRYPIKVALYQRGAAWFCFSPNKFHETFTTDVTTNVECFCDVDDIIGHVCGSHFGKIEKLWTVVSPKLLHGENWNMAHVKCNTSKTNVIFFWWCPSVASS